MKLKDGKLMLLGLLLTAPAVALATTYHGARNEYNGGDTLILGKSVAVMSNVCTGPNGVKSSIRMSLHVVNSPADVYTLTGYGLVTNFSTGHAVTKKENIIMHFKKEPNGDLKLFGKPPRSSAVYAYDSASCAFGLSTTSYVDGHKPYSVVFVPTK